ARDGRRGARAGVGGYPQPRRGEGTARGSSSLCVRLGNFQGRGRLMAAIPVPPGSRRSAVRPGEAAWIVAPGAAARRPRQPSKLKAEGKTWWLAAWESPVSSMWEASEIRQVVRAARLADICTGASVKAAHLVELRRLEDALGLT